MEDVLDFLKIVFPIFVIIAVVLLVIVGLVHIVGSNACQSYAEMGIPVQYDFWTGCMANHPKFGWLPTDDYFKTLNVNIPE